MRTHARGLILAVLLGMEFLLFRGFVARAVAPQPPRNHDQSVYLREAYRISRQASEEGLGSALRAAVARSAPTGLLFPIEGAVLCLAAGTSRLSALTVNFLFFALLQIAVFLAFASVFRRLAFALLGPGLLLLARSPLFWAGGLTDFRIDLAAFCLYGVFLAAALRSGFFASRAWSIVAGAIAGVCVLNRYLTIAYFASLAIGALAGVAVLSGLRREMTASVRGRLTGALWATATALLVAGPAVWVRRAAIWQYYVVGHFGGDGATRARAVGIGAGLFYYPRSVLFHHPGPAAILALLAVTAGLHFFRRGAGPSSADRGERGLFRAGAAFFAGSFAVPFVLLARDPDKSPVVGSILVPPLLLLSVWLLADWCGYLPGQSGVPGADRYWSFAGPAVLATGLLVFGSRLTWAGPPAEPGRQEVVRLHAVAADFAVRKGWKTGVVSSDRIDDSFDANTLSVFLIETKGLPLELETGLPASIHAVDPSTARDVARRSRFLLLTESETRSGGLPFDQSMRPLAGSLSSVSAEGFESLGTFQLPGRTATLWARPGP